ncbi:hypothetical protein [Treponema bryantii]|uniref:hypothetical protein n=1 Tax=Treponema bryantii TaxID=163 RepID=UPI0003B30348|nr:hypothetical protein [Treponema bryantii]
MRKIFSILVVLMMVAGTFVSCSMPTNDSTGAGTSVSNAITETSVKSKVIAESSDGALKLVKDEYGDLHICSKAFSGDVKNGNKLICGAITCIPGVKDNGIFLTYSEWNASGTNAVYDNGNSMLTITCSEMPASNGIQTLIYNGYTLKYKIN